MMARVATLFASRQAESSPSVAIFFEKVVMKAVVKLLTALLNHWELKNPIPFSLVIISRSVFLWAQIFIL